MPSKNFYQLYFLVLTLFNPKYLQDKHFKKIKHLTAIPLDISTVEEDRVTEFVENIKFQALTKNDLKERQAVCRRLERILICCGLTGFPINFVIFHFLVLLFFVLNIFHSVCFPSRLGIVNNSYKVIIKQVLNSVT